MGGGAHRTRRGGGGMHQTHMKERIVEAVETTEEEGDLQVMKIKDEEEEGDRVAEKEDLQEDNITILLKSFISIH